MVGIKPPVAKKSRHSFSHHGKTVHDDYAWLKDPDYPQVEDPEILDYLNQENKFTKNWYVIFCDPTLPEARDRDLDDVPPREAITPKKSVIDDDDDFDLDIDFDALPEK